MLTLKTESGIELCYEERGKGEPLVLIMGIGTQMLHWPDGLFEAFADAGYRVFRFDNRDAGLSSKCTDVEMPPMWPTVLKGYAGVPVDVPYRLSDMAADTAGFIRGLGLESAHVVGVSMGGMIAQQLAIDAPEVMRSLTSVMSTTGDRRYLGQPRAVWALLKPVAPDRELAIERSVEVIKVIGHTNAFPMDEDVVRDIATRAYDRSFYPEGFVRQLMAIFASGSRRTALGHVKVPSLVIHGTADPLVPYWGGKATADAIPGARFMPVHGLAHGLPPAFWPIFVSAVQEHAS